MKVRSSDAEFRGLAVGRNRAIPNMDTRSNFSRELESKFQDRTTTSEDIRQERTVFRIWPSYREEAAEALTEGEERQGADVEEVIAAGEAGREVCM